jgi:hypothetical protein
MICMQSKLHYERCHLGQHMQPELQSIWHVQSFKESYFDRHCLVKRRLRTLGKIINYFSNVVQALKKC